MMHELSHQLGAPDHYCYGPSTTSEGCANPNCDTCYMGRDAERPCMMTYRYDIEATDEDVYAIHQMVDSTFTFSDERMGNSSTMGTYYCFWLFVYGFLVLIALITVFNIINSIAMSVSSRSKQYGAFRAIGLSTGQLRKMIVAEAFTYTIIGGIVGTILGLLSNKVLFEMLISYKWGDTWTIPLKELGIILLIVVLSAIVAVYGPIKRIHNMSIVDTISAQ